MACSAGDGGLNDALLANSEARHVCPKFCDDARELVAQGDGDSVVRARMRCGGREGGST